MGDLVRSEAAVSRESLHRAFNAAVDSANAQFDAALTSPLTITLGDEFQGLTDSLTIGLAVMRHVRWSLLEARVDCRFVVGRVTLATPLNEERAWNMMGRGLAQARLKLEQKREPSAYRFSLPDQPTSEGLMDALGLALTDIEAGWTHRQRAVALASLRVEDRTAALAQTFDVTRTVFYKVRRAAKFDLYERLWTSLTAAAAAMDGKDIAA
jgi:hypothetical protein